MNQIVVQEAPSKKIEVQGDQVTIVEIGATFGGGSAGENLDQIPAGTTNKHFTATEKTKLGGVEQGATQNGADSYLLARENHTGDQTADTISDFDQAVQLLVAAMKGIASGITPLDGSGLIPIQYIPGQVKRNEEYDSLDDFPEEGADDVIYLALDTKRTYGWFGSAYAETSPSAVVTVNGASGAVLLSTGEIPEHVSALYFTAARAMAATRNLEVVTYTDSATLAASDANFKWVLANKATAMTLTVPPDLFEPGAQIPIRQIGAGQLTIAAGSGVTITTPETYKLRKQQSTISLVHRGSNIWDLTGDLEAA